MKGLLFCFWGVFLLMSCKGGEIDFLGPESAELVEALADDPVYTEEIKSLVNQKKIDKIGGKKHKNIDVALTVGENHLKQPDKKNKDLRKKIIRDSGSNITGIKKNQILTKQLNIIVYVTSGAYSCVNKFNNHYKPYLKHLSGYKRHVSLAFQKSSNVLKDLDNTLKSKIRHDSKNFLLYFGDNFNGGEEKWRELYNKYAGLSVFVIYPTNSNIHSFFSDDAQHEIKYIPGCLENPKEMMRTVFAEVKNTLI